jgi:hypothetical protein
MGILRGSTVAFMDTAEVCEQWQCKATRLGYKYSTMQVERRVVAEENWHHVLLVHAVFRLEFQG